MAAQRVEWVRGPGGTFIDVHVVPLISRQATLLGTGVTFIDVTGYDDLWSSWHSGVAIPDHTRPQAFEIMRQVSIRSNRKLGGVAEEMGTIRPPAV